MILIAAGRWWKKEEEKEKQKQKQNHETPSQIKATRKKSNEIFFDKWKEDYKIIGKVLKFKLIDETF